MIEKSVVRNLEETMKMSWSVRDNFTICIRPHLNVLLGFGYGMRNIPGGGHWPDRPQSEAWVYILWRCIDPKVL